MAIKKMVLFLGASLLALAAFAPAAQGGPKLTIESGGDASGAASTTNTTRSKNNKSACKAQCEHARATCRGKQRDCLAARQSCTRAC